jgi:hypothetical protein
MLETFGFALHDEPQGERRYVKRLRPPTSDEQRSALDFHVRYGPPALIVDPEQTFVVPIKPAFHASLFPDAPEQQLAIEEPRAHGNALRKAYLSHANLRTAQPGATLLFYRSGDQQAITAVGVLEKVLVSTDPNELMQFVGSRTVYSEHEVRAMAAEGEVLAYLFRQDRFVDPPLSIRVLRKNRLLLKAPQSTGKARSEGMPWLRTVLDA